MEVAKTCSLCKCTTSANHSLEDSIRPSKDISINGAADLVAAIKEILATSDGSDTQRKICQNCHDEFRRFYTFLEQCVRAEQLEYEIYFSDIKSENELDVDSPIIEMRISPVNFEDRKLFEDFQNDTNVEDKPDTNSIYDGLDEIEQPRIPEAVAMDPLLPEGNESTSKNTKTEVKETIVRRNTRGSVKDGGGKFNCDECDAKFMSKYGLSAHKFTHSGTNYKCKFCPVKFKNSQTLRTHERKHDLKHGCHECSEKFTSFDALKAHKKTHNAEPLPTTKTIKSEESSDTTTPAIKEMKTYVKRERERKNPFCGDDETRPFECEICHAKYRTKAHLIDHKRCHFEPTFECTQCPSRFRYPQSLKLHMEAHEGIKYKCNQCEMIFARKNSLKIHKIRRHGNDSLGDEIVKRPRKRLCGKDYNCQKCSKKFRTQTGYELHQRLHDGGDATDEVFQCLQCPAKFGYLPHLKSHERSHDHAKYYCDQCAAEFPSCSVLRVHQRTHTGETFDCDECDWKFIREIDLQHHKRIHLSARFVCDICDSKFGNLRDYNAHKRMHSGSTFNCTLCPSKFMFRHQLRKHREIHTGLNLMTIRPDTKDTIADAALTEPGEHFCDVCNAKYRTLQGLTLHKQTHIVFKCPTCDMVFDGNKALVVHRRTHTNKKLYKCDECDAKFAKLSDFTGHKRIHSGDTLNCEECGAGFLRPDRFKEHMRLHTGETFDCDLCGMKFTANHVRNRHMMVHTGERPYACDECDWKSPYRSALDKHKARHEKKRSMAAVKNEMF